MKTLGGISVGYKALSNTKLSQGQHGCSSCCSAGSSWVQEEDHGTVAALRAAAQHHSAKGIHLLAEEGL